MINDGFDINYPVDSSGFTLIHYACKLGMPLLLRRLIKLKAYIDI